MGDSVTGLLDRREEDEDESGDEEEVEESEDKQVRAELKTPEGKEIIVWNRCSLPREQYG